MMGKYLDSSVRGTAHIWLASSLGEVSEILSEIMVLGSNMSGTEPGKPANLSSVKDGMLWFRGHEDSNYELLPGLQRGRATVYPGKCTPGYVDSNLREIMRLQHFQARVSHLLEKVPTNIIGWQELEQHYSNRTRYLDWSESAFTALAFAVINYMPQKDWHYNVHNELPCLWVVNPRQLNYIGYSYFWNIEKEKDNLLSRALKEFKLDESAVDDLRFKLEKHISWFLYKEAEEGGSYKPPSEDYLMAGIPCLSTLQNLAAQSSGTLSQKLREGEFNPYHYLLLRYYADALPVYVQEDNPYFLPPLATLQPYHSSRIKDQRGAFTIFPNYVGREAPAKQDDPLHYTALERQIDCAPALYRIRLQDPERIAWDLCAAGVRVADLYPDIQNYSHMLEL